MRRKRSFFVLAMLAMLAPPAGPSRALSHDKPHPEVLEAAKELMAIMSKDTIQQLVTNLTGQIWPSLERAIRAKRADINQATLSELRAEFERIQLRYMSNTMADAPQIYARHFTAQELRDLLAFYRTPTGQKSVQVMPQVMNDLFTVVMPKMQALQVEIMEAFVRVLRERGIDL